MKTPPYIILILLFFPISVYSQEIYFETGKSSTSFHYRNSEGEKLNNLHATPQNMLAVGYRELMFGSRGYGSASLSYAGYGAVGSSDISLVFMEWQLNYLEFNVGVDYEVYIDGKMAFYLKGFSSFSYLMNGVQRINNQVFDAKKSEELNKVMFNLKPGMGFSYDINRDLKCYGHLTFSKSITMKSITNEKLSIECTSLALGVAFNITHNQRNKFR